MFKKTKNEKLFTCLSIACLLSLFDEANCK